MKPKPILAATLSLFLLQACAASPRSGEAAGVRLDPPPADLVAPVPDPVPLPAAP